MLSSMDNWGAFIFFAAWCFISLVYVYLVIPETAGQSLEQIDKVFEGPWYKAYRTSKKFADEAGEVNVIAGQCIP